MFCVSEEVYEGTVMVLFNIGQFQAEGLKLVCGDVLEEEGEVFCFDGVEFEV